MNKLGFLVLFLIGFSIPSFADTTPDGQPILTCPRTVECDLDQSKGFDNECHLSDNPYKMWSKPIPDEIIFKKGSYKLKKVILDSITYCYYFMNDKQPLPVRVYLIGQINVRALSTGLTKWSHQNFNDTCLSDNSQLCPMVQKAEIMIPSIEGARSPGFYFIEKDSIGSYCQQYRSIDFKKLHDICGSTSSCIIDIGYCQDTRRDINPIPMGTVTVDISNPDIVKINEIYSSNPDWGILKIKEPFNLIYLESKKK